MALTTAALVCVAASNGGTISQDLKTGFLVGATPRHQQVSILIGVVTSAIAIGFTLLLLDGSVTTLEPVRYDGFTLPANTAGVDQREEREKGPDGVQYRVAYIQTDRLVTAGGTTIPRGKYQVSDAGELMFFVHPGVVGSYPYKLAPRTGAFPTVVVGLDRTLYVDNPNLRRIGRDEGLVKGPDQKDYRAVVLAEAAGKVPPGRYLIGDEHAIAFRDDAGTLVAGTGVMPALAVAADGSVVVAAGTAIGRDAGSQLGIDRQRYRAYDLTEVVGDLRPGRYLVTAPAQITFFSETVKKFDAPKAQLFRLIIDGTLDGSLPWHLVLIGVFIAIILELLSVSSLPFAVGLYLPISTSAGIFVGGAVRWLVDRKRKGESAAAAEFSPGMLMASGLIAGGAILGVVQALLTIAQDRGLFDVLTPLDLRRILPDALAINAGIYPMVMFLVMAGALYWVGTKRKRS
jgi:hypothetical protein